MKYWKKRKLIFETAGKGSRIQHLATKNAPFEQEQRAAIDRPSQGDDTKQLVQKILLTTFNITESESLWGSGAVLSSLKSVF